MPSFADLVAAADAEIFERLGVPGGADLTRPDGSVELALPVILKRPREGDVMGETVTARERPVIHVPVSACAVLPKGSTLVIDGRIWRTTGGALRPGSGSKWVADVEDTGPA